ncbi:MAG: glycosyltransferase family 1 protein [Candidatus Moraniibacteriota bacterium]
MKLAIQASDLDHARIDGTRVYVRELLRRFGTFSPETEYDIYHRGTFNPLLAPPDLLNYHVKTLPFPYAWMQTRFAWEMFRSRPDRLFLPIQAAPVILPRGLTVTATIHDLAFRRFPETFPPSHLRKLNFMLDTVVRQADRLIAVSESTKRDLLEFFPTLDASKVQVIHHGFDREFFGQQLSAETLSAILTTYQLQPTSYLLYVGALQPRKNLVRLIQAFEQAKKTCPEMQLVLAGEPAWLSESILAARAASPFKDDIILTGRVSFENLRALYQGARLFAFPSLYEGFGLPLLEAFASGVPVLTADNSSLREVAGDGALYVDARNEADIAEKLSQLWSDVELRDALRVKANAELARFSWDRTACATLDVILR